jgi:tRNA (guanine-N7-)-methyltransferase
MVDRLSSAWSLAETGEPIDAAEVFGRVAPLVLEIGFGLGGAPLDLACRRPHEDVIAVDVHTPGVACLLEGIATRGLVNVRVVHGDAVVLLDRFAPGSLAGVRIFFPDPWPKQRQRHRRIVRPDVVDALLERLGPGGTLHLATDVDDYAAQMQRVCGADARLDGGVVTRPAWRPETRFERRGAAEGRRATDLVYTRR